VISECVFKERVHLAVRGEFLSKALVSLGKNIVMGNLTAIVSGFKEKVMSNIIYSAMQQNTCEQTLSLYCERKGCVFSLDKVSNMAELNSFTRSKQHQIPLEAHRYT